MKTLRAMGTSKLLPSLVSVALLGGCLDDGAGTEADTTALDADVLDELLETSAAETTVGDTTEDTAEEVAAEVTPEVEPETVAEVAEEVAPEVTEELPLFSFFVTSIESMRSLSGSQDGFGGDLRFGEATGLAGADKICTTIAEAEMPGSSAKVWRAFLSVTDDGSGNVVNAIDRIGEGPWYDRNGRLVANNLAGLRSTRPAGDAQVKNDLPNERGESQKSQPGAGAQGTADNHDVLTGSDADGALDSTNIANTCQDWTSAGTSGRPRLGHSWPAMSGQGWVEAHQAAGCAAVVNLTQNGPGAQNCKGVGCGGGYGAIYCFAETP